MQLARDALVLPQHPAARGQAEADWLACCVASTSDRDARRGALCRRGGRCARPGGCKAACAPCTPRTCRQAAHDVSWTNCLPNIQSNGGRGPGICSAAGSSPLGRGQRCLQSMYAAAPLRAACPSSLSLVSPSAPLKTPWKRRTRPSKGSVRSQEAALLPHRGVHVLSSKPYAPHPLCSGYAPCSHFSRLKQQVEDRRPLCMLA